MELDMYFIFIEVPKSVLLFNAKHNAPPKGGIPQNNQETEGIAILDSSLPPVNNVHTGGHSPETHNAIHRRPAIPQTSSAISRDGRSNTIRKSSDIRFEAECWNQSMGNRDRTPIPQGAKQID
jgi:hypothetical protein